MSRSARLDDPSRPQKVTGRRKATADGQSVRSTRPHQSTPVSLVVAGDRLRQRSEQKTASGPARREDDRAARRLELTGRPHFAQPLDLGPLRPLQLQAPVASRDPFEPAARSLPPIPHESEADAAVDADPSHVSRMLAELETDDANHGSLSPPTGRRCLDKKQWALGRSAAGPPGKTGHPVVNYANNPRSIHLSTKLGRPLDDVGRQKPGPSSGHLEAIVAILARPPNQRQPRGQGSKQRRSARPVAIVRTRRARG